LLEFFADEVLVGDHHVAGDGDAVKHLGGDDSFADVRAASSQPIGIRPRWS
jgi:hypothetical protein